MALAARSGGEVVSRAATTLAASIVARQATSAGP
jgi:hypothetical protein